VANTLKKITQHLTELSQLSPTRLLETRQERYRSIGSVTEA
jgi:acetyl-CoA carboxylase alpha subunit